MRPHLVLGSAMGAKNLVLYQVQMLHSSILVQLPSVGLCNVILTQPRFLRQSSGASGQEDSPSIILMRQLGLITGTLPCSFLDHTAAMSPG